MTETRVHHMLDRAMRHEEARPIGVLAAGIALQIAGAWFAIMSILVALRGPEAWFFGTTLGNAMPFPPVVARSAVLVTALATFLGGVALGGVGWALARGQRWAFLLGIAALGIGAIAALFGVPGTLLLLVALVAALAYFLSAHVRAWFAAGR